MLYSYNNKKSNYHYYEVIKLNLFFNKYLILNILTFFLSLRITNIQIMLLLYFCILHKELVGFVMQTFTYKLNSMSFLQLRCYVVQSKTLALFLVLWTEMLYWILNMNNTMFSRAAYLNCLIKFFLVYIFCWVYHKV